jgi:putative intracellular protease/amidase
MYFYPKGYKMMNLAVLLFDDFETLDVFGPVEIFGRLKDHFQISFYAQKAGLVNNRHGVSIMAKGLDDLTAGPDLFLIPGGFGTRKEVENIPFINRIRMVSESASHVLTVCTGTALLARTGLLDGRRATTNKRAFAWVKSQGEKVEWVPKARWVVDGKYYTSSGVSAGMDMAIGFLFDLLGSDIARKTAFEIEYRWQEDPDEDNFQAEC